MGNLSGTLALFSVLRQPRILVPNVRCGSLNDIDFGRLKARGVNALVFDKDNCITKPGSDRLEPALKDTWKQLFNSYGRAGMLLVSNSAGSVDDPGLIQAESVSGHLDIPVLVHRTKKPGCAKGIVAHFQQSQQNAVWPRAVDPEAFEADKLNVAVIGDRNFTDIIMAQRLRQVLPEGSQVVSILTTQLWAKEKLGTVLLRGFETALANAFEKPSDFQEWQDCLKPVKPLPPPLSWQQRLQHKVQARIQRIVQPVQDKFEPYYAPLRPTVNAYIKPAASWTASQLALLSRQGYLWAAAQLRPYWQKHIVTPTHQAWSRALARLPAIPSLSSFFPRRQQV